MQKVFKLMCLIAASLFAVSVLVPVNGMADWTILTYMEADNNLSSYSGQDIQEMIDGLRKASSIAHNINILVQLDLPEDNKTIRFKVDTTGRINDETINQEMGKDPEKELIVSGQWIKARYPAQHYFWILWNHGSGVEDYKKRSFTRKSNTANKKLRGILYDDSQGTCLTNGGLKNAFKQIKQILGKNIDIIGMDACLMAMLEVCYQIKDYADYFVSSQQVEPGYGWDYCGFIKPLVSSLQDSVTTKLAQWVVESYGNFYKLRNDNDYTLSSIDLSKLNILKTNIDSIVSLVNQCYKYNPITIKKTVIQARNSTKCFDEASYIDLYSFFVNLNNLILKMLASPDEIDVSCCWSSAKNMAKYLDCLRNLSATLQTGIGIISTDVVTANVCGPNFISESGNLANGISIYYPETNHTQLAIHNSYYDTAFAKESTWLSFIKKYRNI